MILKREEIIPLSYDPEIVRVPEFSGELLVRPLALSEILAVHETSRGDLATMLFNLAARAVLVEDGTPLWPAAEWDRFAGRYTQSWADIRAAVLRVTGNVEHEKKDSPETQG